MKKLFSAMVRQLSLFPRHFEATVPSQRQIPERTNVYPRELVERKIKPVRNSVGQSSPFLQELWMGIREKWFPERADLDEYIVVWSSRAQKRTLASCNVRSRRVIVARELRYRKHVQLLIPLLYHEMCHAYLGESVIEHEGRSRWHGAEFKAIEKRHPGITALDQWIREGGWDTAVRSDRARRAHRRRKNLATKA